jgi:4-amino-4-deoxy-L-arabinose transferase-like glycosyltransferase
VKPGSITRDLGLLVVIKAVTSATILISGFRAVSDDDFARVVLAEAWAHTPKLDPTGTSWLPFPFWIQGTVLAIFGRSLDIARATALVLGLVSAVIVYLAARWITRSPRAALAGAALAAIFPWSARLGVATVPELPTAALTLLALAALVPANSGAPLASRRLLGALALLAATLSRYEPWPIALGFALLSILDLRRARRSDRPRLLAAAAIAVTGPIAWIAWNYRAHGEALHFLTRVAAYKKALGAGSNESALTRLLAYPVALVREEPELFLALAVIVAAATIARLPALRSHLARFNRPLLLGLAQIAALSLAMVKDGAPTHHPERAVLVAMLLAALIAGDLAAALLASASTRVPLLAAATAAVLLAALVIRPRITADEAFTPRADEVAIGRAAAARIARGERLLVEVVDYGHLAILAALGRPEDAVLDRSIDPRDPPTPSSFALDHALRARIAHSDPRWILARPSDVTRQVLRDPLEIQGNWALFEARP